MLDIDTSIDQSFAGMHDAPRFAPSSFAPSRTASNGEAEFIAGMEQQFQAYQEQVVTWLDLGRVRLSSLEAALKDSGAALSPDQYTHISLLIDFLSEQLDQDVDAKALSLKRMRRLAREFRPYSRRVEKFLLDLAKRIEKVNAHEIETTMDFIDWWRGIRSVHNPDKGHAKVFDNADNLIAHLDAL
ncbi:MAG: hypothetical protein ACPG5U_01710 [Planktomarina sp.]